MGTGAPKPTELRACNLWNWEIFYCNLWSIQEMQRLNKITTYLITYLLTHSSSFKYIMLPGTKDASSSRMRVMNHNWSATKQHLHQQSVAEISRHLILSADRNRQCGTNPNPHHSIWLGLGPVRACPFWDIGWYTFGTCYFRYNGRRFRYVNVLRWQSRESGYHKLYNWANGGQCTHSTYIVIGP